MAQDLKIEQELVQIQHLRMEELNVLEMHQNHKIATLTLALLVMIIQNINDRENNSRKFKFLNILQHAALSSYFWLAYQKDCFQNLESHFSQKPYQSLTLSIINQQCSRLSIA